MRTAEVTIGAGVRGSRSNMPSFDLILSMYNQRKAQQGPVLQRMREIADVYNGDVIVPLPGLERSEKAWVANLLQQGLDQAALRISSTTPDVRFLPEKEGVQLHMNNAAKKRDAVLGWWTQNNMGLKLRRRARYLIGYGSTPVMIRPHRKWEMPIWQTRNPLHTFPAKSFDPDDIAVSDCIFAFKRTLAWLNENFPNSGGLISKGYDPKPSDAFEFLEYVDDQEHVLGVIGKPKDPWDTSGQPEALELVRFPNRAGVCPVVVPGRITLDRQQGGYDGIVGAYMIQARLMALEVAAVEKGVFPDTYLISRPGEVASFIDGPFDGRTGKVNVVKGGDIKDHPTNPGFQTNPVIDRLERSQRLTAGIPTDVTGEAGTNIRTGRRSEVLLSAVLDFPVQEAQDIISHSLNEENRRAIAIDKAYFPKSKSFHINLNGRKAIGEYTPDDLFGSDIHYVRYPSAGSDANSLIVGLGQRLGVNLISRQTARQLDPEIEDPEREKDLVTAEALGDALLAGVTQQVAAGTMIPTDVARIMILVATNQMELPEAVMKVQAEAQERQAAQAEPGSPETMPGIAQPGMGAEAGAGVPAGPPSLPQLLQGLGGGTTQTIIK